MDKRQERREKVIKGLECCNNDECDSCPYYRSCDENDLGTCKATLHRDALALLKSQEQEPIVPIKRSAHAQGANDVWYECGKCGKFLGVNPYSKQFCANCGRVVKWDG